MNNVDNDSVMNVDDSGDKNPNANLSESCIISTGSSKEQSDIIFHLVS